MYSSLIFSENTEITVKKHLKVIREDFFCISQTRPGSGSL